MKKIWLALTFFLLGALGWKLIGNRLSGHAIDLSILLMVLAILFLANGAYGIISGRVFGRSWKKYWGGWCYRTEEPFYYWSYTLGHLLVGAFLLAVMR